MKGLNDIYTYYPNTNESENFSLFVKAHKIIEHKFLEKDISSRFYYENIYSFFVIMAGHDKHQITNKVLSKIMLEVINETTDYSLKTKNNIVSFLDKSFEKKTQEQKNNDKYITCNNFCKNNGILSSKLNKILLEKGYYNEDFKFMPSRLAIDNNKVLLSTYFMPYASHTTDGRAINHSLRYEGNFYILWEHQFLRNMMLKHYKKCKKDTFLYQKRYKTPSNIEELIKKITQLVDIFTSYDLLYFDCYSEEEGFCNRFAWEEESMDITIAFEHDCNLKYCNFKGNERRIKDLVNYNLKHNNKLTKQDCMEIKAYLNYFCKYCKYYEKRYS